MDIEIGASVLMEFFGIKERMKCQFVGLSGTDFLVLRVPLTPGVRDRLREGNMLTFRYLHQGALVGFRSEIIHYMAAPFSLLFVSYPMEIQTQHLRGSQRVVCNFPAVVESGKRQIKGVISDISAGGCRFIYEPPTGVEFNIRPGESLSGRFHLLEKTQDYPFRARVVSVGLSGGKRFAGLRFDLAQTRLPDSLRDYIDEIAQLLEGEKGPGQKP